MRRAIVFTSAAVAGTLLSFVVSSCQRAEKGVESVVARADLEPLGGSGVSGVATFTRTADGVSVEAHLNGLAPGKHGFHIHEWGDCSAPDGTSSGAHFNPDRLSHGGPEDAVAHAGDLGNLEAGDNGHAMLKLVSRRFTLDRGDRSVVGRAVIVHEKEDDLKSQPTGAAGARLACGVILLEDGETRRVLPAAE